MLHRESLQLSSLSINTYQNLCFEHSTPQKLMTVVGIVRSGFEKVTTLIGLEHPKLSNLQFWHDFPVKSSQNFGSEHFASSKAMNVITFFEPVRTIPTTVITF